MAKRKKPLTHGSLFTGVGGIDLGFDAAGIDTKWQCEIDELCQSVLRRHWPKAKLYTDVTELNGAEVKPVDIITFGSPCQDLSIAGKRKGMKKGTRSNLYYEAIRIIQEMQEATNGKYPKYAIWENVRGALSSREGRDFEKALQALVNIGAVDIAWRVVNTANFGPPQRRVRVFVVADFRGRRAGEILFEPTRVLWHPATSGTPGEEAAGDCGEGVERDKRKVVEYAFDGLNQVVNQNGIYQSLRSWYDGADCIAVRQVASTITSSIYHRSTVVNQDVDSGHLITHVKAREVGDKKDSGDNVAYLMRDREGKPGGGKGLLISIDRSLTLKSTNDQALFKQEIQSEEYQVRRLTPRECERLQGWPDDHTRYTDTGVELKDSPRYRMIGNGVSAPVAQWIGENIVEAT